MTQEIEAAAVESALGDLPHLHAPAHTRPPGSPCANCGAVLQGPWCHACGQLADDFHRSGWKLIEEAIEGLFHLDGRVWFTLRELILHPGRLTRSYIHGKRAPQLPPLRLILVVMVGLFALGSLVPHEKIHFVNAKGGEQGLRDLDAELQNTQDADERAALEAAKARLIEAQKSAHHQVRLIWNRLATAPRFRSMPTAPRMRSGKPG